METVRENMVPRKRMLQHGFMSVCELWELYMSCDNEEAASQLLDAMDETNDYRNRKA